MINFYPFQQKFTMSYLDRVIVEICNYNFIIVVDSCKMRTCNKQELITNKPSKGGKNELPVHHCNDLLSFKLQESLVLNLEQFKVVQEIMLT